MKSKRQTKAIPQLGNRDQTVPSPADSLPIPCQTDSHFFKDAPFSIWVEDLSRLKFHFESLKKKGIHAFRDYFETHPEEVLLLAKEIKIINVNEATIRLYQAENKEEVLKGLRQVFNKGSYTVFREALIAFAEGKRAFRSEAVNLTMKGEEIHLLMELVIPPGYESTWSCVFVYLTDITGLKARETQVKKSEEKYRRLFESASDAIFLIDTQTGIFLDANKAAGKLLGIPSHDIVGMHFTEIHPKEGLNWYKEDFRKHVGEEKSFSDNLTLCDRKGRKILVSVSSSIIEMDGARYAIGIFRELGRKDLVSATEEVAATGTRKRLSEREGEILRLIAKGYTSRQIARELFISEKTVGTHRTRMRQKLNLHRTVDLVRYALTSKLID